MTGGYIVVEQCLRLWYLTYMDWTDTEKRKKYSFVVIRYLTYIVIAGQSIDYIWVSYIVSP